MSEQDEANKNIQVIWDALDAFSFREGFIPEWEPSYDDQWKEICTAMTWIEENLK